MEILEKCNLQIRKRFAGDADLGWLKFNIQHNVID